MSATELAATSDGTVEGSTETEADDAGAGPDAVSRGTSGTSGASADGAGGPTELSKDVVFDILKNGRRRQVLRYLEENPATTLSDLAEHVAALENDKPVRELSSSERKRVYVGLYQCHLPKMADAGVVDYDRSRGTVELRDSTSLYFVYLDIDPTGEPDDGDGVLRWVRQRLAAASSFLRPSTVSVLGRR